MLMEATETPPAVEIVLGEMALANDRLPVMDAETRD
jgi:hypothetical protein